MEGDLSLSLARFQRSIWAFTRPPLFRAMAEHDGAEPGAPLDFGAALDGMVKFRGGRPLHCMA